MCNTCNNNRRKCDIEVNRFINVMEKCCNSKQHGKKCFIDQYFCIFFLYLFTVCSSILIVSPTLTMPLFFKCLYLQSNCLKQC